MNNVSFLHSVGIFSHLAPSDLELVAERLTPNPPKDGLGDSP